jgi:hypothetical protein
VSPAGCVHLPVTSAVTPSSRAAWAGAGRGLLGALCGFALPAPFALAVLWVSLVGTVVALAGPLLLGVPLALVTLGATSGAVWGAFVGGRRRAARMAVAGAIAFPVTLGAGFAVSAIGRPGDRLPRGLLAVAAASAAGGLVPGSRLGGGGLAVTSAVAAMMAGDLLVGVGFVLSASGVTVAALGTYVVWATVAGAWVTPCDRRNRGGYPGKCVGLGQALPSGDRTEP